MEGIRIFPGDVVVTNFVIYQHWSLVSDQLCAKGKNMLISASKRTCTVQEEEWDTVTQGKKTYVVKIERSKPVTQILADARSQIGRWKYSVVTKNCEHFVKWASGMPVSSSQVTAGVLGGIAGALLVGSLSEKPNFVKLLAGACFAGGLAINDTKVIEKHQAKNI